MADICHLENWRDVIFFCRGWSDWDKISQTGAEWHVDCGDMVKIENLHVAWHVIPHSAATLQGVATWRIQCHDPRATCHIAGCSHLAKSMSWLCHIAGCKNSIRHIENRFSPYFIFCFVFNAVLALMNGGFRIVSDTLVISAKIFAVIRHFA